LRAAATNPFNVQAYRSLAQKSKALKSIKKYQKPSSNKKAITITKFNTDLFATKRLYKGHNNKIEQDNNK